VATADGAIAMCSTCRAPHRARRPTSALPCSLVDIFVPGHAIKRSRGILKSSYGKEEVEIGTAYRFSKSFARYLFAAFHSAVFTFTQPLRECDL
jgi:hypothetical protein